MDSRKKMETVAERGKNNFKISRSNDTPKIEPELLCKSKEAPCKRLSLTTFCGKSKKTEGSEIKMPLVKVTGDMEEALEKRKFLESSKKTGERSLKGISLFQYSKKKKEEKSEKKTDSESLMEMKETCKLERSASTEENEELPKRKKRVFGHQDEEHEYHKEQVSLEPREKVEEINETRDSFDKSANGEKRSWRKSWFLTEHNETQTTTEKELNLPIKSETIEPVKRKVRPGSQEMGQNTEKTSGLCGKSKAIEGRPPIKKHSSFSLSKKASERGLDTSRSRLLLHPRVYIRRVGTFLRTTLNIIFISTVSCWRKTRAVLRSTENRLLRGIKTSTAFVISVTPRKMVKYLLIYSCHLLPGLRNRSAVLCALRAAPSQLTKRIASAYLRKVPVCVMGFHAHLLLKGSPIRKIAKILTQVLRLPRVLLDTAFMGPATVMKVLSRATTLPRVHKPQAPKRLSSRPGDSKVEQSLQASGHE